MVDTIVDIAQSGIGYSVSVFRGSRTLIRKNVRTLQAAKAMATKFKKRFNADILSDRGEFRFGRKSPRTPEKRASILDLL